MKNLSALLKSPTGRSAIICISGLLVTSSNQDNTATPYQTFNMAMNLSPSNSPFSSSESELDNDFETEEHTVQQALDFLPYEEKLQPLATDEEADEYDNTIKQQQELERQF